MAEEEWPKDKLRGKIAEIRAERKRIQASLDQAEKRLETGRLIFTHALELLDNPEAMYRRGGETVRSLLNRAFFTRLYVEGRKVVGHDLKEFGVITEAYTIHRRHADGERAYHRHSGPPGAPATQQRRTR